MIDETMKMPEPIIEPATSMVESRRPSPRMNLPLVGSDDGNMRGVRVGRAELIIRRPRHATPKDNRSRPGASVLFSALVSSRLRISLVRTNFAALLVCLAVAPVTRAATAGALQYEALPLIRSAQNHLLVRAEINGKPALLGVDTGAPVSAIAISRRQHFGLTAIPGRSKLPAHLRINGAFNRVAIAHTLCLGALNLVDEPMVAIDLSGSARAAREFDEQELDGILGADILFPTEAVIDCETPM